MLLEIISQELEKKLGLYCVSQNTSVCPRDSSLHVFSALQKSYFLYSLISFLLSLPISPFQTLSRHFRHQLLDFQSPMNQEGNISLVHSKRLLFSSNKSRITPDIYGKTGHQNLLNLVKIYNLKYFLIAYSFLLRPLVGVVLLATQLKKKHDFPCTNLLGIYQYQYSVLLFPFCQPFSRKRFDPSLEQTN